uniref:Uncharacterized protein n=1 Tax=Cyprinus carpio TaxID=7962 RepID=A0A8C2ILX9_CYPCA
QEVSLLNKEALDELCRNKDIVIKLADKGGGLVIMPRALYNHEVLRQLENTSYYQALPSNPTTQFQSEIKKFIQEARPVFYILPVLKSLVNPPGRPIVAGNNILRPLVTSLPSYPRDTADFL